MSDYVLKNGSTVFTIGGNKILTTRKPSTFTYQNFTPGVNYPTGIVYDSANSNKRLFVTNQAANTVTVHDKTTFEITATITGFNQPFSMCIDPVLANNRMFVSNNGGNTISIVDLETLMITGVITSNVVGIPFSNPNGIDVDAATNRMFVANFGNGMLYVLNATTFAIIIAVQVAPLGSGIVNCLLNPYIPNMLLITNFSGGVIYVLNSTSYLITNTIPVTSAAPIAFDTNAPRFVAGGFGTSFRLYNAYTLAAYSGHPIPGIICNAGLAFDPDGANHRVVICVQGSLVNAAGSLGVVKEVIF